jgi:restriction system protein
LESGRVALASCKRWKVAQTGIEPLRELLLAKETAGAQECIYVTAGDLSQNARQFAAQNAIRLLCADELAQLLSHRQQTPRARVTHGDRLA